MKTIIMVLSAALCCCSVHAQVPREISYQGYVTSPGGAPVNTSVTLVLNLYNVAMGGAALFTETQTVPVTNGVFQVRIGSVTALNLPFDVPYYLGIKVGADPEMAPRQPLAASAYAIRALTTVSADTATSANQLAGVAASQYLQANGNGSGLTSLDAGSLVTGTLNNARLGQIPTPNIADSAVTAPKIAAGQVVKGVTVGATTLTDNVTFAQGNNITITPSGNTLTIASTSGGVGGSGALNSIPFWSTNTSLGTSQITQSVNGVQLPNGVQLAAGAQGNHIAFGSPSGETGMTIAGSAAGRADVRFDGSILKLVTSPGPNPGTPSPANGIAVDTSGKVGIGTIAPASKLDISASGVGAELLRFSTERPWGFRQISTGSSTALQLYSTVGQKLFEIAGPTGENVATFVADGASSRVGIGTIAPSSNSKLHIVVPDAAIYNAAILVTGAGGNDRLVLRNDGTLQIGALYDLSSTRHACYYGFNTNTFAPCSSAAEYVPTVDDGSGFAGAADLVSIAPSVQNPYDDAHAPFVVVKSSIACDSNLLGFIVNPESGADGKKVNEHYLPLAIYGYFPAKVTLENGPIKRGDPITSSSRPGYGMKATRTCKIIGYALEDAQQEGQIQVFANHGESTVAEVAALRATTEELHRTVDALKKDQANQQARYDALAARINSLEKTAQGQPTKTSLRSRGVTVGEE